MEAHAIPSSHQTRSDTRERGVTQLAPHSSKDQGHGPAQIVDATFERWGYRMGRFVRSIRSQPTDLLSSESYAHDPVRPTDPVETTPRAARRYLNLVPSSEVSPPRTPQTPRQQAIPQLHDESAALQPATVGELLMKLRENLIVQYGLKRVVGVRTAELVLGGALIVGAVLTGDLVNVSALGGELFQIATPIIGLGLHVLVGPGLTEVLIALTGVLGVLIYQYRQHQGPKAGLV